MIIKNPLLWYKIKTLCPKPLFEPLISTFYFGRHVFYKGENVVCPICNKSFSNFLVYSDGICPYCGSAERHRSLYLYLKRKTEFFQDKIKVLHFAPEHCFCRKFGSLGNVDYISGDLNSPRANEIIDMTNINYPDGYFDVILSIHVLEHVDNDLLAMDEIFRVLKPNGWSINLVPIDRNRKNTYEDPEINTPEKRHEVYGHVDHRRIYGRDYKDRLERSGFKVMVEKLKDFTHKNEIKKFGLNSICNIYRCVK